MPDAAIVRVERVEREASELWGLTLSLAGTGLAGEHRTPGQYAMLSLAGQGEEAFAIASRPGAGERFEFLVKRASPLAEALCALAPGATVGISGVLGKGFALDAARGRDVLCAATGSGISAIRSAIEAVRADRAAYGRCWLLFGARASEDFAYRREFTAWRSAWVDVIPTASRPDRTWSGKAGHIQAHLPPELDPPQTAALLCGRRDMVRDMTEALVKRGVARERILLNF